MAPTHGSTPRQYRQAVLFCYLRQHRCGPCFPPAPCTPSGRGLERGRGRCSQGGRTYWPRWGWSGGQPGSSSACRRQGVSSVRCILPTAAEGSRETHFELNCYRARNLHSLVGVYLSHGGLKLKSSALRDLFRCPRFYYKHPSLQRKMSSQTLKISKDLILRRRNKAAFSLGVKSF